MKQTETQLVTFKQEITNLPASLASSLQNSLIVGVPGSGKGIFVTNALEHIQQDKQRQVTVFYIDPKNDPNETGYFSGRVDYLFRQDLMTCDAIEAYAWFDTTCDTRYQFFPVLYAKLDSSNYGHQSSHLWVREIPCFLLSHLLA